MIVFKFFFLRLATIFIIIIIFTIDTFTNIIRKPNFILLLLSVNNIRRRLIFSLIIIIYYLRLLLNLIVPTYSALFIFNLCFTQILRLLFTNSFLKVEWINYANYSISLLSLVVIVLFFLLIIINILLP